MVDNAPLGVRLELQGADKVKKDLDDVGESGEKALKRVGDAGEAASQRLQRSYATLTQSLDPAIKAQAQLEKGTKTLDDALAKGLATQDQHARFLDLLTRRTADFGNHIEISRREIVTFGRALAEGRTGEAAIAFTRLGLSALGASGGVLALVGATVGIPTAFLAAANASEASIRRIQTALVTSGGASGMTAGDVESLAWSTALSSGQSITSAKNTLTRLVGAGAPGSLLQSATALAPDLGKALGSNDAAQKLLEQVFADPAKSAKDLETRFNLLSAAEQRHIEDLAQSGHSEEAQRAVVDALSGRFRGLADNTLTHLESVFQAIGNAAANAWEHMGKEGRGALTPEDTLAADQAKLEALLNPSADTQSRRAFSQFGQPAASDGNSLEVAAAQAQVAYDKELVAIGRRVAAQKAEEVEQDKLIRQGAEVAGGFDSAAERTRKYSNEAMLLGDALKAAVDRQGALTSQLQDTHGGNQTAQQLRDLAAIVKLLGDAAPAADILSKNQQSAAELAAKALLDEHKGLTANIADRERVNGLLAIERQYQADLANKDLATSAGALRDQRISNLNAKLGQPTADALSELRGATAAERDLAAAFDLGTEAGERQKIVNEAHLAFLKGAIRDEGAYRDALLGRAEAEKLAGLSEQAAAAVRQTGNLQRIASASADGPAAVQFAAILNAAHASADPSIAGAKNDEQLRQAYEYLDVLIKQGVAQADLNREIRANDEDRTLQQTLDEKQLELSLMGKNATLRAQELADLRLKNQLINEGFHDEDLEKEYEARKKILDVSTATDVAIKQQADAQRQTSEAMKQFADEFGSAIEKVATTTGDAHKRMHEFRLEIDQLLEKQFIFKPFESGLQSLLGGGSENGGSSPNMGMLGVLTKAIGSPGGGGILGWLLGSSSSSDMAASLSSDAAYGRGAGGSSGGLVGAFFGDVSNLLSSVFGGSSSSGASKTIANATLNIANAIINGTGAAGSATSALSGGGSGLGGFIDSLLGGGLPNGGLGAVDAPGGGVNGDFFATGGAWDFGNVRKFAAGAVFQDPTYFNIGQMGEAGPESIMPLQRMPGGKLGVSAAGGGGNHYWYLDARGAADPKAFEAVAERVFARHIPAAMKMAAGSAVGTTFSMMRQGGRAAKISGKR